MTNSRVDPLGPCSHCNRMECPCSSPEAYSMPKKRCSIGEVRYHPGHAFTVFCNGEEEKRQF